MYKGITPTLILTLPDTSQLLSASNVYVTLAGKGDKCRPGTTITKKNEDLSIEEDAQNHVINVSVFLTQEETLSFNRGEVAVQVNWTYIENDVTKRACSTIGKIAFTENLINGVIE